MTKRDEKIDAAILKIIGEHGDTSLKTLRFQLDKLTGTMRTEKAVRNRLYRLIEEKRIERIGVSQQTRYRLPTAPTAHGKTNGAQAQVPTLIPIPDVAAHETSGNARDDQEPHDEPIATVDTASTPSATTVPIAAGIVPHGAADVKHHAELGMLFPPHWRMLVLQLDDETLVEVRAARTADRERQTIARAQLDTNEQIAERLTANMLATLRPLVADVLRAMVSSVEHENGELRMECDALREALDRQQGLRARAVERETDVLHKERDRLSAELAQAEQREREYKNRIAALETDVELAMQLAEQHEHNLIEYRERVRALAA